MPYRGAAGRGGGRTDLDEIFTSQPRLQALPWPAWQSAGAWRAAVADGVATPMETWRRSCSRRSMGARAASTSSRSKAATAAETQPRERSSTRAPS